LHIQDGKDVVRSFRYGLVSVLLAGTRQPSESAIGQWRIEDDGRALRLDNGPVWLRRLAILNHRALRIPDRPPPEPPPHMAVQTAFRTPLLPFRDPFHLRGVAAFPAWIE